MLSTVVINLFLFCVFVVSANCNDGEYYWRPWTSGSPPSDAVTTRDYRGVSYIVEAYVPSYGLFIGQVFANQHEVNISVATKTSTFIVQKSNTLKVLCSQSPEKLAWYPTNYRYLQNELITAVITPVLGGININDQVSYIGRYVDINQRTVNIGSVIKDYSVHYHYTAKAYIQNYYEILVIGSKCSS